MKVKATKNAGGGGTKPKSEPKGVNGRIRAKLILPILLSLLLLLVVDLLDVFWNFASLSAVVLMCSLGISLLIKMVLESTVKESE